MVPLIAVLMLGCLWLIFALYRARPIGRRRIKEACEALAIRAACVEHERMRTLLDELRRADASACTTSGGEIS
tara:strand:+ start:5276 stop:5494 length:219 start_codon:yes stop_codon:yes gene_type:complete